MNGNGKIRLHQRRRIIDPVAHHGDLISLLLQFDNKAGFILGQLGYQVAMVGDGINDAPAMVQADLSIAVHSGGQLSREAADITLMRPETGQIIEFLEFAKQVNKKIIQNLSFTFLYNAIGIPIAMSGLLSPLVAVTAMLLSSLSVTGNTLMLVRRNT